jgi:hypothetical protein
MRTQTTPYGGRMARRKPGARIALYLLAAALFALAPAAAVAQDVPVATAVLYEVRETVDCNPGDGTNPDCSDANAHGFGTRIADATLQGCIRSETIPQLNGVIDAEAASILSRVDWTGPAHGKLSVNSGGVHAVFSGQLNLSLAILGGTPIAPISGHWRGTKGTLRSGGRFEGVFLIPFQLEPGGPWFYLALGPDGRPTGQVVPLDTEGDCRSCDPALTADFCGGVPAVKLVVAFYDR